MMIFIKVEFVDFLFERVGFNKCEVKDMVEVFFEEICNVLEIGDGVKFFGFGNF